MQTVSAHDVAAELRRRLSGVGAKKLHKLLYYCQGHHVATFGTPLFTETISAWDMGPVVGSLWYAEREAGPAVVTSGLDEAALNTVGYVLSRYGALTGADLERLTHSEAPWQDADRRRQPGTSAKITLDALARYFRQSEGDEEDATPLPDVDTVSAWLESLQVHSEHAPVRDSAQALRARLANA